MKTGKTEMDIRESAENLLMACMDVKEGEQVLLRALNCSQGARYLELAEGREANEDFLYGWVKERVL